MSEAIDFSVLAGMSRITALKLKLSDDSDLHVTSAGPDGGKYSGWVLAEGRPIISTEPIFDSPEASEQHMRQVIVAARAVKI